MFWLVRVSKIVVLFFISGKKGDLKELAKDLRENFPEISENFDIVKKVGEGEL